MSVPLPDHLNRKDSAAVGLDSLLNQLRRTSIQEGSNVASQPSPGIPAFSAYPQMDPAILQMNTSRPYSGFSNTIRSPPGTLGQVADNYGSKQLLNLFKPGGQILAPAVTAVQEVPQEVPQPAPIQPVQLAPFHSASTLQNDMPHTISAAPAEPSDLLAAFTTGTPKDEPPKPAPAVASSSWTSTAKSSETEQYLLNLLNLPKPSQKDEPSPATPEKESLAPEAAASSEIDTKAALKKTTPSGQTAPANGFVGPTPPSSALKTTRSSKWSKSVKSTSPSISANNATSPTPALRILKKPSSESADAGKSLRGPSLTVAKPTPVFEVLNSVPNNTAAESNGPTNAAAADKVESSEAASGVTGFALGAENTKKEAILEVKEKGEDKDGSLPPVVVEAGTPRVVTIDAHGGVADSWENADQDPDRNEIVVLEDDTVPVKVFNLPMKPWISIDVQDDDKEGRPQFQDDSILDIARLKKEFDQIDRNLVAASENYMAYGMSRAGGLRVIRQIDGKDAKLFTDTKDRIFNIAMSINHGEQGEVPMESIIGTGVSGTVYWIQIRDGDKDHLEFTHPEMHGFVLPPIMSHEGDAPGGVLKTRARTSTSHPEYFAVGRGKSINIVWPFYIMQNNLFKPGHDRVVDTEKLSKQCSLKINTGKAGKDFTFSQDDSVVVSLDKSGRVKFWDVRELTAVKKSSEPHNPLPAHTSLEVIDPLMTLTTTPEGEKAWPTSVLLLDKMRPYQKQCALRYMIVGMKQNHTLQLWDLALGKPVQEFNLPHSKESDAVCSVVYHPPTGMIVVGHPTRNSVYLLHLSAPKYAMKSMSQVEYIQRLNAQDSSIPEPESTAVISGIREYSLDNKGSLRSLDILQNPASNAEGGDPTLFELYAMHSRGVSCVFIRVGELGWNKDNKVISAVDAIGAGKVTVKKLKAPQQPIPSTDGGPGPESAASSKPASRIVASRSPSKDSSFSSMAAHKSPEQTVPVTKGKGTESRNDDAAHATPNATHSTDRAEKRNRKKKAAPAPSLEVTGSSDRDTAVSKDTGSSSRSHDAKTLENGKPHQNASKGSPSIGNDAIDKRINTMESRICERVSSAVHVAVDSLKKNIDDQFRVRDTDFEAKQTKLLELVSNVLNSNTQHVLSKIIREEFENTVVPALRNDVTQTMTENLAAKINPQVSSVLQKELQKSLPAHVAQGIRNQDVSKTVSDAVARTVANHVDDRLRIVVSKEIIPAISTFSAQAVAGLVQDVRSSVATQMADLKQLHAAQNNKIESLTSLLGNLSETLATLTASQQQVQEQLARAENHAAQAAHATQFVQPSLSNQQQQHPPVQQELYGDSSPRSQVTGSFVSPPSNPTPKRLQRAFTAPQSLEQQEQADVDAIAAAMEDSLANRRFDEAMLRWLQSNGKEEALFRQVLVNYAPDEIVNNVQPLILLSAGTTVTQNLEGPMIIQKLSWIEMVLLNLYQIADQLDNQTREIAPNVLMHMRARLEETLMHLSKVPGNNQSLKSITQIISVINRVADIVKPQRILA